MSLRLIMWSASFNVGLYYQLSMRLWSNLKNSGLQKQGQAKNAPLWLNCEKRSIRWTLSPATATAPVAATQATETKRIKKEELYLMSNMKGMLPTQKDLNTEAMTTISPHLHNKTTCPIHSVFSCLMNNSREETKSWWRRSTLLVCLLCIKDK
jgi:hypothetical protein